MTEHVEAVVIGAGIIGLACARALARQGREVIILEQHAAFGTETSARNSEVIHAGIYYSAGSHKAKLCVRGRALLYAFCADFGVSHQRCGKLIVATSQDQLPKLEGIRQRALANGVDDLRQLTAGEAKALEPTLACTGALFSPSTGIIDSHALMVALLGDAQHHGAVLALNSPAVAGHVSPQGLYLLAGGRADTQEMSANMIINAAGLHAPGVAAKRLI